MKKIGLTGGIASGKSLVTQIFRESGIPVCDTDVLARQVVEPGQEGLQRLKKAFGLEILTEEGTLNRALLGKWIFDDAVKRQEVNQLLHPLIFEKIDDWLAEQKTNLVLIDMPLLFETDYDRRVDESLLVLVSPTIQLERLMARDHISYEEALKRVHAQMPLAEKIKRADVIIDNNGSREETKKQVLAYLEKQNI